jgi:hypothetical protein
VSLFRPLATNYSQSLDKHTRLSLGLVDVSKRDFFRNFYPAFDKTFTEANIRSGWHKTSIEPFDPEQVLKIFRKDEEGLQVSTPSTGHSSSCLDYLETINNQKRKKKRGRPFTEDLRAEEGLSVLFFSPS